MIQLKRFTAPLGRGKTLSVKGLTIPEKGAFLIYGDNGTGKTTLVRHLTGILKAKPGTALVDGVDVTKMGRLETARVISYLPQTSDMEVDVPVADLIQQGLYASGKGSVGEVVRILGLKNYLKRNFSELSGGEKQLVRIARAMAPDVRYTFLDEPDSFLSRSNKAKFMELVAIYSKKRSIVIVSHDELKFQPRLIPLLDLKG